MFCGQGKAESTCITTESFMVINSLILEERETFCEVAPLLLFTLLDGFIFTFL